MRSNYLWGLESSGCPYRISAEAKPDSSSHVSWKREPVCVNGETTRILKMAAAHWACFALDRHGHVYVFVLHNDIAIRSTMIIYSNQRWYPIVGWSSSTLPTDRATFSDEAGHRLSFDSFTLPSDGWRWEQHWRVMQDRRRFDSEGWEYAFNFGANASWTPTKKRISVVRRRQFRRTMRYVAMEQWLQMREDSDADLFTDIVCGSVGGECLLFGIAQDGRVRRRAGIGPACPEGEAWTDLEQITDDGEFVDATQLSMSARTGQLAVLSWDGRVYLRRGIREGRLDGEEWVKIRTPRDLPTTFFALGSKSIWLVTTEAKVWVHSSDQPSLAPSTVSRDKYFEVSEGQCRLSVSADDQVFAISRDFTIHIRSAVHLEKGGRKWEEMRAGAAGEEEQEKEKGTVRWHQVDAGGCGALSSLPPHWLRPSFVPLDSEQFRRAEWRSTIANRLCSRDDRSWAAFRDAGLETEEQREQEKEQGGEGWLRETRCQISLAGRNWADGKVYVNREVVQMQLARGTVCRKSLGELLYVDCEECQPTTGKVVVECRFRDDTDLTGIRLMFSNDEERKTWKKELEEAIRFRLQSSPRDRKGQCVWVCGDEGGVRCHFTNEMIFDEKSRVDKMPTRNLPSSRALSVPGCMRQVATGAERAVWAVDEGGSLYILSPSFDVLLGETSGCDYQQNVEKVVTLTQYARYAVFRGFVGFSGRSGGVAEWMDERGRARDKGSRLPPGWRWTGEWRLVGSSGTGDENGWQYADTLTAEEWGEQAKTSRCRRRVWQRVAVYSERSTPWMRVDCPPARGVRVGLEDGGEEVRVAVVTREGDVLERRGVTRECPAGTGWTQVLCDFRIRDLVLEGGTQLALTECDRVLRREAEGEWLEQQVPTECSDLRVSVDGRVVYCSVGDTASRFYDGKDKWQLVSIPRSSQRGLTELKLLGYAKGLVRQRTVRLGGVKVGGVRSVSANTAHEMIYAEL